MSDRPKGCDECILGKCPVPSFCDWITDCDAHRLAKRRMKDPLTRTVGGPRPECLSGAGDWMCERCDCWKSARAYCS
jgi:hypothetical protein